MSLSAIDAAAVVLCAIAIFALTPSVGGKRTGSTRNTADVTLILPLILPLILHGEVVTALGFLSDSRISIELSSV